MAWRYLKAKEFRQPLVFRFPFDDLRLMKYRQLKFVAGPHIGNTRLLVTGASRGLGRTLAFAFAAAGAREVFAGARKAEDIEKLTSEAAAIGAPIMPIKLDVTVEDDLRAAAGLGFVDILINNAGVAGYGDPLQMNFENASEEMNVNYFGALRMARAMAH